MLKIARFRSCWFALLRGDHELVILAGVQLQAAPPLADDLAAKPKLEIPVTVTHRWLGPGEQLGGVTLFFVLDHVETVRGLTDSTGDLAALYDYDPWGRRTLMLGNDITEVGFTRHFIEANNGLWLTANRAYDPNLGRWLTEDLVPVTERKTRELNAYAYVGNSPIQLLDPYGLNIHGNYCGPGGAGPITDGVDKICYDHDLCYNAAGASWLNNMFGPKTKCLKKCDDELCKKLMSYQPRTKSEQDGWFLVAVYFKCRRNRGGGASW